LGDRPITAITAQELLKVLKKIEDRGARETAHRVLHTCGQIFRYAIRTSRAVNNPAQDLKEGLSPVKKGHLAALVRPEEVAQLMRAIHGYQGDEITRCALKLAALFFVRPGELRKAEWSEIDFENQQWVVPAKRMKIKTQDHIVPFATQALEILRQLHTLTGHRQYLFPSPRDWKRPVSDNTVNAALRRMGYTTDQMTAHGFRATARTILDEVLHVRPDFIEHQLAHAVRDANGRAYNRTSHLPERRKMMQQWADYLEEIRVDGVRPGAEVVQIGERVA
jgi:integrase